MQKISIKLLYIMLNYVSYTISYRDSENNPRDINNLTYKEAQKQAKMLINIGVIWLEIFKVEHHYLKVYDYENYKNRPNSIDEIIRNRKDLERSKIPNEIKKSLLSLW